MRNLLTTTLMTMTFTAMIAQQRPSTGQQNMTLNPNSGYANVTELTYGYGLAGTSTSYSEQYYGFTTSHGYQLNIVGLNIRNHIFMGLGSGILFYTDGNLVPAYADFRFTWTKKKIEPFLNGTSGVLLGVKNLEENTKMFLNGGGGIRYRIDDSFALSLGAGVFLQMGTARATFINLRLGIAYKSNKY
jgi:hypothetical protein